MIASYSMSSYSSLQDVGGTQRQGSTCLGESSTHSATSSATQTITDNGMGEVTQGAFVVCKLAQNCAVY